MEPETPNSSELIIINGEGDYGPRCPGTHARILSGPGGSIPSWGRTGKVKDTESCDVRNREVRLEHRNEEGSDPVKLLERRPRPKGKLGGPATFHALRWGWGAHGYGKICRYTRWCDPRGSRLR